MRILKVHLPIAIVCGLTIYAVLQIAAWYNLRDERNICRRQSWTRSRLNFIPEAITWYHQKTGEYPESLQEYETYSLAEEKEQEDDDDKEYIPGIVTEDEWGNLFQYSVDENGFTLKSLGRDGKPGGIGLDADLYHDDRNHDETLATFKQYFTETDTEEVDRGGSEFLSLVGAVIVSITLLSTLVKEDRQEPFSFRYMLLISGTVVIGAIAIGVFLLPLHIPSGH